jgi:hypothetical protein
MVFNHFQEFHRKQVTFPEGCYECICASLRDRSINTLSLYDTAHIGAAIDVGIATGYGLDGPGLESRWRLGGLWGPPSLLYNRYRVFPKGKAAGAWC